MVRGVVDATERVGTMVQRASIAATYVVVATERVGIIVQKASIAAM